MFLDAQRPASTRIEEVSNIAPEEIGLKALSRTFKKAQILPAYYTCGRYTLRINSDNDTYLEALDRELKRKLSAFCNKHDLVFADTEEVHREENRFTKQYTILPHF